MESLAEKARRKLRLQGGMPAQIPVPEHGVSDLVNGQAIVAAKVWSDTLGEAVWVVVDDLPRDQWPTDASVYTHTEVKILRAVGPGTVTWVHVVKQMFGADVVRSGRRAKPAQGRA
jgi:hypothetical protein